MPVLSEQRAALHTAMGRDEAGVIRPRGGGSVALRPVYAAMDSDSMLTEGMHPMTDQTDEARLAEARELERRWSVDGSAEHCVRNIVCHLNMLLTDEEKEAINWHPEQSASLAVMRVLGWLVRDRADALSASHRACQVAEGRFNAELEEAQNTDKLLNRLSDILERTANALKGPPGELKIHSWHDLPEVAEQLKKLLKRYLDNHCQNSDAEGTSVLCECKLCKDTRTTLRMKVY